MRETPPGGSEIVCKAVFAGVASLPMAKPLRFGPPPETTFEVHPSAAEIAFFRENGFLVVGRLTSDAEVDWI